MAITIIETDTSAMARDIEQLEERLRQLESHMKKMFTSVQELDAMWDGPSNEEFNRQFQQDYRMCEEMCGILRELIGSLRHARTEYEKCEQNVDGMIRSLRI